MKRFAFLMFSMAVLGTMAGQIKDTSGYPKLRYIIKDNSFFIQMDSTNVMAYGRRGDAKLQLGDYKGAAADYTKIMQFNYSTVGLYDGRGLARYYLRDYKGAISDYKKTLEIDPDYLLAYGRIGATFIELHQCDSAIFISRSS